MKKILLITSILITNLIYAQFPGGGSAYQDLRLKSDGVNKEWKSKVAASPLTYTASTNTFGVDTSIIATKSDLNSSATSIPLNFVNAATTSSLSVTYSSNTVTATGNGRLGAIDGVVLTLNQKALLKNQSAQLQNGIYYVLDTGTVSSPYKFVRDSIYDEPSEIYPSQVNVYFGTTLAGQYFLQTIPTLTVGVTSINYTTTTAPLSGTNIYTANGTIASNRTVGLNNKTIHFASSDNLNGKFEVSAKNISLHNSWNNNSIDINTTSATTGNVILRANQSIINSTPNINLAVSGGVGVSTSIVNAHASSILDLTSTTKGLLIPRLTTTQMNAISSPATGLKIFNTTVGVDYYYSGAAWLPTGSVLTSQTTTSLTATVATVTIGSVTTLSTSTLSVSGKATVPTVTYSISTTDAVNTTMLNTAIAALPSLFTDAGASTYLTSTTDLFGVGTSSITASMTIKGQGSTSATDWLNATNASGSKMFTAHNDGRFTFGPYTTELTNGSSQLTGHFIGRNGRTALVSPGSDGFDWIYENNGNANLALVGSLSNTQSLSIGAVGTASQGFTAQYNYSGGTQYVNFYSNQTKFMVHTGGNYGIMWAGIVNGSEVSDGIPANLGYFRVVGNSMQIYSDPAVSGTPLGYGSKIWLRSCYWNGSTSVAQNDYVGVEATSTAGARKVTFNVGGSERMQVKSTGVLNITPMTATAASALTPAEGDIVFVSTTNGTFLAVGFHGYQGGIWVKM